MSALQRLLVLPRLQVQNANALSSPFTIGFPAMTAWLGAVHALQRKLHQRGFANIQFMSVGVVSHQFDLQTHRGSGDFVSSIIGTGNPLDKDGKRPSFIEEARAHLTVSLLVEYQGLDDDKHDDFLEAIEHIAHSQLKMAGGDILAMQPPYLRNTDSTQDTQKLLRKLMPGYVLIERRDLMIQAMENGQDAMDALIDYLSIHHSCTQSDEKVQWQSARKEKGWLVPIAVGFQGISPIGQALNQRDSNVPHCFAEAVVTLGEFKMAYRIDSLSDILWRYKVDAEHNLYSCQTKSHKTTQSESDLSEFF